MSSSSISPFLAALNPLVGITITDKLLKNNHAAWKARVLAAVRGARLMGHLTGVTAAPPTEINQKVGDKVQKVPNLEYDDWYATDQQVLGFILRSQTKEVLPQVSAKETAVQLWEALEVIYASKTRAHAVNTRVALATAQKGNQSITKYVGKMRSLANEMAAAVRKLDDAELVEYIRPRLRLQPHHLNIGGQDRACLGR
jgi:hypothetical protein